MSPRRRLFLGVFAAILLSAQDKQPAVQITGAVKQPLNLTAGDLAKMARATVRINTEGTQTVFEGVWLHEVLKKAGAPEGMHGKALAAYLVAEAQDGYQVVFSLGEINPDLIDNEILLADTANGKPLGGAQGRFQLLAPKDKHRSRSVRMLTRIDVVQVGK